MEMTKIKAEEIIQIAEMNIRSLQKMKNNTKAKLVDQNKKWGDENVRVFVAYAFNKGVAHMNYGNYTSLAEGMESQIKNLIEAWEEIKSNAYILARSWNVEAE